MTEDKTRLIAVTEAAENELRRMADDWRQAGDDRYDELIADCRAYVERCAAQERGDQLPAGRVAETTYWLTDAGERVLGRASLRHWLTPRLERTGGHIGYDVRPSERRKGYDALILSLALAKAYRRGLPRALVTCEADDAASARVIETNGGALWDEIVSPETGASLRRYWVEL